MAEELQGRSAVPPREMTSSNKYYWNKQQSDFGDDEAAADPRLRESMVNKLISTVYSGPTISDIESALSFTGGGDHHQQQQQLHHLMDARNTCSPPVIFSPEKVLSKMENKYTLKIKTSTGNGGLAEDGYKWRKYGQKSIKNSPNPRSYYRCTNPRCNAKKQVERATDEADTLLVTYEGLHLHYTYTPHFLLQPPPSLSSSKKPKLHPRGGGPPQTAAAAGDHLFLLQHNNSSPTAQQEMMSSRPPDATSQQHAAGDDGAVVPAASPAAACCFEPPLVFQQQDYYCFVDHHNNIIEVEEEEEQRMTKTNNNGLLEDVVPLLVRRPCSGSSSPAGGTSSSSRSSPPPAPSPSLSTSSSVSWNPTSPYIDMAILSNIF